MGSGTDSAPMMTLLIILRKLTTFLARHLDQLLSLCMKGIIVLYRTGISPFLPARCRFLPTCSAYGLEAVDTHGFIKGTALLFKRIVRCHPWGSSGVDPVPPKKNTDYRE